MTRQRTITVAVAILALTAFGAYYLMVIPEPDTSVVMAVAAGIAGLGGYELRERSRMDSE